jgi:hypothetical protein
MDPVVRGLLMSVDGTKRTSRDVRYTAAIGGQADIEVALGRRDK